MNTGIRVLHKNGKGSRLNTLEVLEINKESKNNNCIILNKQLEYLSKCPILKMFPFAPFYLCNCSPSLTPLPLRSDALSYLYLS